MEKKTVFNVSTTSLPFRLIIGLLLVALLLIPVQMIEDLISERSSLYEDVIRTTSATWGAEQTITGPFLIVPIKNEAKRNVVTYYYQNNEKKKSIVSTDLVLVPENMSLKSTLYPTYKHRGIYKFVVYNGEFQMDAQFSNFDFSELRINNMSLENSDLDWQNARLKFEISDSKGISGQSFLKWNNQKVEIKPINSAENNGNEGFYCFVPMDSTGNFRMNATIKLKGSQSLSFIPLGKNTKTDLYTHWESPKFFGNYSPDSSYFAEGIYHSSWNLSQLSRSIPNSWLSNFKPNIEKYYFGVEMIEPVDKYQQTYRSAKYSILFILLSFLTIFFFEFFTKRNSNILQYILIGLSLVLFYSLLLSLTEQMSFAMAYLLASAAIIGLITSYFQSIFHKWTYSFIMLIFWSILYGFLYLILQLEDYALLAGNIFLFIILALIMIVSRRLNNMQLHAKQKLTPKPDQGDML